MRWWYSSWERGLYAGVFQIFWRGITGPFTCDPGDKAIVAFLYVLMLVGFGWSALYQFGSLHHGGSLGVISMLVFLLSIGLLLWIAFWGADIEDVNDTFDDPVEW